MKGTRSQYNKIKELIESFEEEAYSAIRKEIHRINEQYSDENIKNTFDKACEEIICKHKTLEELQEKNSLLEEKLNQTEDEKIGMKKQMKDLEDRLKELLSANAEETDNYKEDLETKKKRISYLEKIIERVRKENDENKDYLKTIEDENEGLKMSLSGLKKTINELESKKKNNSALLA